MCVCIHVCLCMDACKHMCSVCDVCMCVTYTYIMCNYFMMMSLLDQVTCIT